MMMKSVVLLFLPTASSFTSSNADWASEYSFPTVMLSEESGSAAIAALRSASMTMLALFTM